MALGGDYITLEGLKQRLDIPAGDQLDDTLLSGAIAAATRSINAECGRDFQQAETASPRRYCPAGAELVITHDIATTSGLAVGVDDDGDGVAERTLEAAAYELEPTDGIVGGLSGWPYWRIRLVDSTSWPAGRRRTIQVTARWGWPAVPAPIIQAAYVLAEDLAKLKDTPFGVGGFGEFGRIRARENPHVAMLIRPYRRGTIRVEG